MNARRKKVIVIAGPTAVGKTALAIRVARQFSTEIISSDSRQCFKELSIGVARPSAEQLAAVKHHFIATHSVNDEVNAVSFEQYALAKAKELFQQHNEIVMVGGTGLYIKAFCEGLDDIPAIDPLIREDINRKYEENGMGWLQEEVKEKDPEFYKVGEVQNPRRLMRALEVISSTGQSVLQFRLGKKATRDFDVIKIGLGLPKEERQRNISSRVDQMIKDGLVEEVRGLLGYRQLNALQTVGYSEVFNHLDGLVSLDDAIAAIKKNTWQYARRQMTWFRKDKDFIWFDPREPETMLQYLGKLSE